MKKRKKERKKQERKKDIQICITAQQQTIIQSCEVLLDHRYKQFGINCSTKNEYEDQQVDPST